MQAAAARARRLLASPAASGIQGALTASHRGCAAGVELVLLPHLDNGFPASPSSPHHARSFSSHLPRTLLLQTATSHWQSKKSVCCHMARAHFSTESSDIDHPKESAEELYQKMLKSVEAQTMPPNAWLWSMISSCSSEEDIKLLFQILQKLRIFMLICWYHHPVWDEYEKLSSVDFRDPMRPMLTQPGARVNIELPMYANILKNFSDDFEYAYEHGYMLLDHDRLSNLRINANFNDHLCMKVSEACARVGVLDYGLKVLWNHNVYGITPTIGSAHYLLQHAKEHNDIKLMERIMQVLRRNSLPLQPGTADIVFSICYNADRWDLLSKYAARFVQAGVKLRRTAFDIWMEFAAKVGDSQSIWEINSLRGKSIKHYTLTTGFACAKGSMLERKPENAAATIKLLYKHLPDQKKPFVKDELQKLVAEWPTEVIKRQKKDDRKAMEEALIEDIPKMISSMGKHGLDISVDLDKLTPQPEAA